METARAFLQEVFAPSKKMADYRYRLHWLIDIRQEIIKNMDNLCKESNLFLRTMHFDHKLRMRRLRANGVAQLQWIFAPNSYSDIQIIASLAFIGEEKRRIIFQTIRAHLDDNLFRHKFSLSEQSRMSLNYQARCLSNIIKFVEKQEKSRSVRKCFE